MIDKGFVWHLGGGQMSLPMCEEIKRRGYELLITDLDPYCICRPLADMFAPISVYGSKDNLSLAAELSYAPQAVLTTGTDAGGEVAEISKFLGLPGINPQVAWRVHSKTTMRGILDLPHPLFAIGGPDNFTDWEIYPCVVKATSSSGSKGFSIVNRPDEMPAALKKADAANRSLGLVIVEELLEGEDILPGLTEYDTSEAAFDFFVEGGKVYPANGALRLFHRDRPGIEAGHFNPFEPDAQVMRIVQRTVEKLGVTWGPFKADFKKDTRYGWTLLETAVRLSGGYDSSYTSPLATGRDIYGAYLDMALGQPLDHSKLINQKKRVACCLAPVHKPGKISNWMETGMIDGQIFYRTSTEIKPLDNNADRPVFIIADGQDWREAYNKAQEVAGRVEGIYVS